MIDITQVGAIHEDYQNLTIKILSKHGFCMWENSYKNREAFNKISKVILKKFDAELKRREKELNKV